MTLIFLPLIVLGAVVAWAAGARPRQILVGAAAGAAVLLVTSVVLIVGVAMFDDGDDSGSFPVGNIRGADSQIEVTVVDGQFAAPRHPIDGLVDGETRLLDITGLPANRPLLARQCREGDRVCDRAIPVKVDPDGRATFLFEFDECASCSFVVTDEEGGRLLSVAIAFGVALPEAAIVVDRTSAVQSGDELAVSLTGFTPGSYLVSYCTPPGPVDPARCGAPADQVTAIVGEDGTSTVRLPVHDGKVGMQGASCGRGHPCAVAVLGRSDVAVVPLSFAGSGDAQPHAAQVAIGLAVAAALLAVAFIAMRRGPWTPPDGDPFAGIVLGDPFAGLDDDDDDADDPTEHDQPATSRRENDAAPTATSAAT